MHDECPDHWYLCVIDFKNSHIQILDSLRSKNRDKFRFQSVKTVVEFCQTFFKLYDIGKDVFQFSIDWAPSIPTQENGLSNDLAKSTFHRQTHYANRLRTFLIWIMTLWMQCELVEDLSQPAQTILDAESLGVGVQLSD
ncbi:hypothetical protein CK203_030081 [Vitis vinifera]|uniref:Ubiquitin-like protease family profile domain-containing protein n=1 Tax=Vitis vinifera TaxID=29760 RepID=A0A438IK91_VITVI|nr:hypothetical protein CK203_030081 [Vitis vinifera]